MESVITRVIKSRTTAQRKSDLYVCTCVRLQTELVFLPINHKNYNFREKKNSQVMKEKKENLH